MRPKYPGSQPKFKDPEKLRRKVEEYFEKMDEEERPYTITGLALHLDASRHTLCRHQKYNDTPEGREITKIIDRAKLRCENFSHEQLFRMRGSVAGVVFNLKNNYGWKDEKHFHADTDVNSFIEKLDGKNNT